MDFQSSRCRTEESMRCSPGEDLLRSSITPEEGVRLVHQSSVISEEELLQQISHREEEQVEDKSSSSGDEIILYKGRLHDQVCSDKELPEAMSISPLPLSTVSASDLLPVGDVLPELFMNQEQQELSMNQEQQLVEEEDGSQNKQATGPPSPLLPSTSDFTEEAITSSSRPLPSTSDFTEEAIASSSRPSNLERSREVRRQKNQRKKQRKKLSKLKEPGWEGKETNRQKKKQRQNDLEMQIKEEISRKEERKKVKEERIQEGGEGLKELIYKIACDFMGSSESSILKDLHDATIFNLEWKLKAALMKVIVILCVYEKGGMYDEGLFTSGLSVDMEKCRGFPLGIFAQDGLKIPVEPELIEAAMYKPEGAEENQLQNLVLEALSAKNQLRKRYEHVDPRDNGSILQRVVGNMRACADSRGLSATWTRPEWMLIRSFRAAVSALVAEFARACLVANLDRNSLKVLVQRLIKSFKLPQIHWSHTAAQKWMVGNLALAIAEES